MKISILVADSLHINKKNFASFFKYIEQTKPDIEFENTHKDWWALYGNYESKSEILYEKIEILSQLSVEDLFEYKIHDISLFEVCRAELLSVVAIQESWFNQNYPSSLKSMFERLFELNRTALLQNMAAAWYWLNFWNQKIIDSPVYQFCCIFSGSLIYQRSLMEILKCKPTKVMVFESLFTGSEYYCEERYSPIANRCDIMHKTIYQHLIKELRSTLNYDNERMKAINKVILMKNKNVQQPINSKPLVFHNDNPVVTILGQVINDFSLLEMNNLGISSINTYKQIIISLIQANFNIVFKSHPWENQKSNVKSHLTFNIIQIFIESLPKEQQKQIQIVSDYSIKQLFKQSTYVLGISSQGLIEAAFEGFKPIQLGNAFFGGKGFTHDYKLNQIDQLIYDLSINKISPLLTLQEFDKLEEFLTALLQKHTISSFDSGLPLLRERFALPAAPIALAESRNTSPKPADKSSNVNSVLTAQNKEKDKDKMTDSVDPALPNTAQSITTAKQRKWEKFKRSPRLFFAQSQYAILRSLKYFFPKGK